MCIQVAKRLSIRILGNWRNTHARQAAYLKLELQVSDCFFFSTATENTCFVELLSKSFKNNLIETEFEILDKKNCLEGNENCCTTQKDFF